MSSFRYSKDGNEAKLFGPFDERSNFEGLFDSDFDEMFFELEGIDKLNAHGVRSWVKELRAFEGKVFLRRCSIPVTEQLSLIPEFLGKNTWVESFYAPFYCEDCDFEENVLLILGENFDSSSEEIKVPVICPYCEDEMEPDFDLKEYFFFVREMKGSNKAVIHPAVKAQEKSEKRQKAMESTGDEKKRKPLLTRVFLPTADNKYVGSAYTMFSENISSDGLFIATHMKLKVYDKIKVELKVPVNDSLYELSTEVEIRWIRKANSRKNVLPGVGCQFLDLTDEDKEILNIFIKGFNS